MMDGPVAGQTQLVAGGAGAVAHDADVHISQSTIEVVDSLSHNPRQEIRALEALIIMFGYVRKDDRVMETSATKQFASHCVTSIEQLESLYGAPTPRALIKEIDFISDHYREFIEKSPFVVVSTSGPEGLDSSPRGDPSGFVRVWDEKTVLIPDRRGNNRLDTLRNLVQDPRISLLFLIPGVGETLRINGRADIVTEPELRATFTMQGKVPTSVLVVTVERIYFQCQKALVRSGLWRQDTHIPRSDLPSTGKMLEALSPDGFDGATYDRDYPDHMKKTIY